MLNFNTNVFEKNFVLGNCKDTGRPKINEAYCTY